MFLYSLIPRLRRGEPGTFYHMCDVKGRCEVDTTYLHAVGHTLNLDRPHSFELMIEASTHVGYEQLVINRKVDGVVDSLGVKHGT